MELADIMGLLGGLALFLYGMQMMSSGLEAAAGDKMKQILERLTANRFLGVFVGAVITAIIQSSSATTVMVVGFVNSGMMTLRQAVWIIMGANIGTTITGQLIALDVGVIAPMIAFVGVAIVVFSKKPKLRHIGNIFAGLGVLFIGMDMMGAAMKPLANSEGFVNLLSQFENPILGILAGAVFTAIIQSSSASVGILQALANSGVVQLSSAAFVLFGQNIGTCITAFLASIGTSRNAKRTTIIHIMFNIIGTIIFTTLCIVTPLIVFMEGTAPGNPAGQIANLHTTFNVVTSILLIPFGTGLAFLAEKILPDKGEEDTGLHLEYIHNQGNIQEDQLGLSAMSMNSTKMEVQRMLEMAKVNVNKSFDAFRDRKAELVIEVDNQEEYIDYLNKEISKYISRMITHERTEKGSEMFNSYFKITSNIERIGDHAVNIAGYTLMMKEKDIKLSDISKQEVVQMQAVCNELFEHLLCEDAGVLDEYEKIASLEQKIDDMTEEFRSGMMSRIQQGICSDEGSILFSEMLTDFERIGDHALNISKELTKIRLSIN
ncbi:MAG: Na/Pi cotransporter family protein [Tyzzerella sp.]|nr:Na/Pi cotransporter family protein [Tyzzerella sp.]